MVKRGEDKSWWLLHAPVVRDRELLEKIDKMAKNENRSRASMIKHLVILGLTAKMKEEKKNRGKQPVTEPVPTDQG